MFKLRFWWVILKALFTRTADEGSLGFLVLPSDCDINLHLNNGNYLRFMDLARWHWSIASGSMVPMLRAGLRPMAVRVEINFKRALPPFARFRVVTGLRGAAEKSVTLSQQFFRGETLVAEALVTVVFVRRGRAEQLKEVSHYFPQAWQERVRAAAGSS